MTRSRIRPRRTVRSSALSRALAVVLATVASLGSPAGFGARAAPLARIGAPDVGSKTSAAIEYATYWGGSRDDNNDPQNRTVSDAAGNVYVLGGSNSRDFPRVRPLEKKARGAAILTKFDASGRIVFSTFVDGLVLALRADAEGNCYVAGQTDDAHMRVRKAFQKRYGGNTDLFVAKLGAQGGVVYSTYLGGTLDEEFRDLDVDASGNAYLFGTTISADVPVHAAFESNHGNGDEGAFNEGDGLVAKFDPAGAPVYVTYIGGGGRDEPSAFCVGDDGSVTLGGRTSAGNLPVANAAQSAPGGGDDSYFVRLGPDGTARFSTYYGGSDDEELRAIGLGPSGELVALLGTRSSDVPVANAVQPEYAGGYNDLFLLELAPTGERVFATYFGGSELDVPLHAPFAGQELLVDASGDVFVAGFGSEGLPLRNAYAAAHGAGPFVAKFRLSGELVYSTFLHGTTTSISVLRADAQGDFVVAGDTTADFPVKNAAFPASSLFTTPFVAKLGPQGDVIYATILPGLTIELQDSVRVDASGAVLVLGGRLTDEFPLVRAFQSTGSEGVTKLDASGRAVFSTRLGGSSSQQLALPMFLVDDEGTTYVAATTNVADLKTVNAVQADYGGEIDAYVTALDASGDAIFSTYLGGAGNEYYVRIGLDASGVLHVVGTTTSTNLRTVAAAQASSHGGSDLFVAAIAPR